MKSENNPVIYRKDYKEPNYWVKSCNLGLMIEPDFTLVKSKINFEINTQNNCNTLELNGVDIDLLMVLIDGRKLSEDEYSLSDETINKSISTPFNSRVLQLI